ncbi:rod shape-determining protein [candidate division WWE3 bacterium CG09_land_8_20_14_0_10_39_24]|uniref:Cell shape-determining protein MreB n=2 Tax=Katanobacteria TaxID=422282 RepID=A0A2G9XCN9_UNCKA|nr:MAG: rod shape-determining protein [bacterium CG2_30_40_12]OJI09329.1 MAG: rod shape-determining protein [bacterium CG09_39_24]PIP04750.1 MAG: rod shape-determining protein [candidate division WWE3 bacterium CG23_combo_of_CG06-09_8_20_14_all_40_14]PIS13031.1 MAG: rod shape-determining protein [candidate division WWE3 bacterium CG09_land_8_20_14_0_10_39_24]PJE51909.1 MAG: rod shape-determining protein [candidate division WWE3 bacterium CG10_big_fil_rev_8_21_14_0_10_39_14]
MLLDYFFKKFSYDLGIDLGTSNTIVLAVGKGIILNEPTVVAINKKTKDILAIGGEAKKMLGKTPDNILVIRPLRAGVVSDFDIARKVLLYFLERARLFYKSSFRIAKPRVLLGVPSGITEVERRAVSDAAKTAGARIAFLVEEPLAAAVGAGLEITKPSGVLIVDIGGGTTEIAVISLGGIVVGKSIKTAGDQFDLAIVDFAKEEFNLVVGEKTAEECKIAIGNVLPDAESSKLNFSLRGRDLKTGLPKTLQVNGAEIKKALASPINSLIAAIKDTVEDTPPELIPDIIKQGITLSGGGSLIKGLDVLISRQTEIKVKIAGEPMTCVARGCAKILEDIALFKAIKLL